MKNRKTDTIGSRKEGTMENRKTKRTMTEKLRKIMASVMTAMLLASAVFATVPAAVFAESAGTVKIEPNVTYSGSITNNVEKQEYVLELDKAGKLDIDFASGLKRVEASLRQDGNGRDISFNYIDKGSQSFSYDLAAGKYYYTVSRYTYDYTGSYSFTMYFTDAEETYAGDNNTINAVRSGAAIPFGQAVNGQFAVNDDRDYFKVVLPTSGRLSVSLHSDITKLSAEIYDESDKYLTTIGYGIPKGDQSFALDLKAGTYYLQFERYTYDYTGNYRFAVSFTSAGETYIAENDSVNAVRSGKAVPLCSKVTGQIAINDEYDYYKLVIPKNGNYKLSVTGKMDSVEWKLLDSRGEYIKGEYHKKGSKSTSFKLNKGTYFLAFERCYSDTTTGVYTFTIQPSGIKLIKATSAKKAIKVTWKKGTGTGYELQYSTDSKFRKGVKTVTIKKAGTTWKTIKKLKSGRKYYVRIRSYIKANGKVYRSGWSAVKAAKAK